MAKFIPAIFDDVADYQQRLKDERNKKIRNKKRVFGTAKKKRKGGK